MPNYFQIGSDVFYKKIFYGFPYKCFYEKLIPAAMFLAEKNHIDNLIKAHPGPFVLNYFKIEPVVFDKNIVPFSCHRNQNSA